jgi:hypothetical protein
VTILRGAGVLLALGLSVASCSPSLGEYRLEGVSAVPASEAVRLWGRAAAGHPVSLKVSFSSSRNLAALGDSNLYVHGDICPIRDPYRLHVSVPYWNDRPLGPTFGTAAAPRLTAEDVKADPATGRYQYVAYLSPARRTEEGVVPGKIHQGYDLPANPQDVCLRVDHAGYYFPPSRSNVIVVSRAAIKAALGGSNQR